MPTVEQRVRVAVATLGEGEKVHAAVDMLAYRGAKRHLLEAIFEAAPKQTEDWIIGETVHSAETSGDWRAALRALARHAVGPDHQDVNRCAKRLEDASANLT